jgi:DNA-binding LytR/AlgR family response regulator
LAIISLLTELVSWIVIGKPAVLSFYTFDLFIIGIWFFVINGIYVGLHFYNSWQETEDKRREENRLKSEGLVVRSGRQDTRVAFEALVGLYVEKEYVVVCHTSGKKYYMDESLEKIEKKLPVTIFFRLNRQYILNRQMVSGFRRAENGKLQVLLHQHKDFPAEIQVSRTKAPAFKSWFQPG